MKKLICFFLFLSSLFLKLNCEETVVEKAKEEFNKKNYKNVINILGKEEDKYRQNPELNYYVGVSYYNLKNTEKATSYLENLIYKTDFEKPPIIYDTLRILFEIYWKDRKIENVIQLGNYALKKFQDIIAKSTGALQIIKYNLCRAYNETGNNFFWSKNYQKAIENYILSLSHNPQDYYIRERLGESYYNISEYEKSKEQFLEVIKNEKNNWYILLLSVSFYREISDKEERSLILKSLPDNSLPCKIFKTFENFDSGMIEEGFEILKDEEEKRKTDGDITFNIINRIFPYDLKSSKVYMKFIKLYPSSSRNQWIINNLFNTISEENERKILEENLWSLLEELSRSGENKSTVVNLFMNVIERKFDKRLTTIEDYLEKINMFEKLFEKIDEDKNKEEIMKRIADNYMKIDEYEKARENYRKIIELFGKENYYLQIAESYFKEGNIDEAERTVNNFLKKNPENENGKLLVAKIYLEKGEIKKGFEILKDIEATTKDKNIQKEIENLKNNFFEMKDKSENLLYIIFRKTDLNSTRLIPEDKMVFLNQLTKEIEFYPYSENERKTNFHLICKIDGMDFSSEPYVMINKGKDGFYLKWEGEIFIDKNDWKKKNVYKVIYPVEEIISNDFDLKYKNEIIENKFILSFEFNFKEENWEISIKNFKVYDRPLKIDPVPSSEEVNLLSWKVDNKNFKIKIEYPENKNILFYFPEIEAKKKNVEEIFFKGGKNTFDIENFKLVIDNFIPKEIKIMQENIKIYNIKERIFRR
jgi:tetratricopeptide (TPR) repeat protein